jgi:HD-GYP domain-containing protein (c-di-GMP phosphodiesterase class II)
MKNKAAAQPGDGIDRRIFLDCMAWAVIDLLWSMVGGVPPSQPLAQTLKDGGTKVANSEDFSFVQIMERDIGEARNGSLRGSSPEAQAKISMVGNDQMSFSVPNPSEPLPHVISLEPRHCNSSDEGLSVHGICLALAQIADTRCPGLLAHSVSVARLAVAIAKLMGLNPKSIKLLQRAATVHDIGKVGIPNTVLEKSEALTSDEWREIQRHPRYTKEILDMIPGFEAISTVAVAHHERLDGSGYPCGLSASELTLPTRILTVADIYDALTSQRPYRRPLGREEAILIMNREAPGALDHGCLDALATVTSYDC